MGDGHYKLPVFVVGEAPGKNEDRAKKPFVGMAGKKLRAALTDVGLHPAKLYFTNVAKCFPSKSKNPTFKQADACSSTYLAKEIEILQPRYVLALGKPSFQALTGQEHMGITEARGKIHPCRFSDALVFATYHPAYILRRDDLRGQWERDLSDFKFLIDLDQGEYKID